MQKHQFRKNLNNIYDNADKIKADLMKAKNIALAYAIVNDGVNLVELKHKTRQYKIEPSLLLPLLYLIMRMNKRLPLYKLNNRCIRMINSIVSNDINRKKETMIKQFLSDCRKDGYYYYLCSSHDDCALDHENYQGLIYRDSACPGAYYLSGYRDIQWVMDHPVYMITRPYCRHYFVPITYDEAKRGDIDALKRKYHTHTHIGNRKYRTPAVRNVELYRDRLQLLKRIYKVEPSLDIKKQILKTEMLLKKWEGR